MTRGFAFVEAEALPGAAVTVVAPVTVETVWDAELVVVLP
jgi:hypothetical protein